MHKFKTVSFLAGLFLACTISAYAEESSSSSSSSYSSSSSGTSSSSSQTVETKGVMGIKNANKFAFKYKERLATYAEQIEMGLNKGWLTAEEVQAFKSELARLVELEKTARQKEFPQDLLNDLERQVSKFNIDLTKAANKPAKSSSQASTAQPDQASSPKATENTAGTKTVPTKPASAKTASTKAGSTKTAGSSKAAGKTAGSSAKNPPKK